MAGNVVLTWSGIPWRGWNFDDDDSDIPNDIDVDSDDLTYPNEVYFIDFFVCWLLCLAI
jgi:hypothetical protein